MADFSIKSTVNITCHLGLADILSKEVSDLGYRIDNKRETGIELTASLRDCIRLNYWLRTAHRVHYLIAERPITRPDHLPLSLPTPPSHPRISPAPHLPAPSPPHHPPPAHPHPPPPPPPPPLPPPPPP